MSYKSNDKKNIQLGMSASTASNRLRKMLLFALAQNARMDTCFRCGNKITKVSDLSIDHKVPWLDSANPIGLFFDLENIAFSHFSCNVADARQPSKATSNEERLQRKAASNRQYRKNKGSELMREQRRAKYLRTGT